MEGPSAVARMAALFFAFTSLLGMAFFADHIRGADMLVTLSIHGIPAAALLIGGLAPTRLYRHGVGGAIIAILQIAAMPMLATAIYRDMTLINGADWPAAVMRTIELGLALLFLMVAIRRP